jgi:hypothetical protein
LTVPRRLFRFRRDEGSALAFVMVGLPVLIIVFAIVVDGGQWFVHKRDLQNQVDAATFAGSQLWGSCFKSTTTNPPWLPMQQEAQNYDGEAPGAGHPNNYNPQLAGALAPANYGVLFNSQTFPISQPSNVSGPDDTPSSPCTLTTLSDGKQHYIFDVKATQQKVPYIFSGAFFGINGPDIHATARTELDQVQSLNGLLPIGVSDPSPKYMQAQFVDEDNSDQPISGWIDLCKSGTSGCGAAASGAEVWKTLTPATVTFPSTTKNVGVRIKFIWSGTDNTLACGSGQLVDCYDNVPSQTTSNGLVHIRVIPTGVTGLHVEDVVMNSGGCTDGYFAAGTCDAGISAKVDMGDPVLHPITSHWANSCPTGCAQVFATIDGAGQYPLDFTAATPLTGVQWWSGTGLTLPTTGPHDIGLSWKWQQTSGTWKTLACSGANNNPCKDSGTFNGGAPVQRAFVADNGIRSGPIQGITLQIADPATGTPLIGNPIQGSTYSIGIAETNPCFDTQFADPTCPLVDLRVSASATGSQSQSLDCDPAFPNIKDEVANGCTPFYTTYPLRSGTSACPTQSVLWNSVNDVHNPWDCVAVQTGNGDVEGGLKQRIGINSATCANAWPDFPANDRRQVPLFLVPFSAFNNSGSNQTYPVIGFAAFYITGYKGDPCPNATTSGVQQGTIPGHFIIYLPAGPGVIPSNIPCDPLALTPCIPVLVK